MRCEYTFFEDFLHRWVFYESSIAAFDVFESVYEEIVRDLGAEEMLFMLVDYRPGGMPPLRMMVERIREIYRRVGRAPRDIRVAYVMNRRDLDMMEPLNSAMLDKLPSSAHRRYFEDEDEALDWLRSVYQQHTGNA